MRVKMTGIALCAVALLSISSQRASAGCLKPPADEQTIAKFRADPQALVAADADARNVEILTRDLVGTDASLATELVRLAAGTAPRFRSAIAAGLAQAAIACSTVDQHASLLIQQAVASFQDGQFQATFAAVEGDMSTAATDAATASASASVGSVIVVNPNSATRPVVTGGGGAVNALVQITAPSAPVTSTSNSNSATAASPVSATR